jgi:hypothetical protein
MPLWRQSGEMAMRRTQPRSPTTREQQVSMIRSPTAAITAGSPACRAATTSLSAKAGGMSVVVDSSQTTLQAHIKPHIFDDWMQARKGPFSNSFQAAMFVDEPLGAALHQLAADVEARTGEQTLDKRPFKRLTRHESSKHRMRSNCERAPSRGSIQAAACAKNALGGPLLCALAGTARAEELTASVPTRALKWVRRRNTLSATRSPASRPTPGRMVGTHFALQPSRHRCA